jgi:hypothetical protein
MVSPILTSPVAAGANGPRPICTVNTVNPDMFWSHVTIYLTFSGVTHELKVQTKSVFIISCCYTTMLNHNSYYIYHHPYCYKRLGIKKHAQSHFAHHIRHTDGPCMAPEARQTEHWIERRANRNILKKLLSDQHLCGIRCRRPWHIPVCRDAQQRCHHWR